MEIKNLERIDLEQLVAAINLAFSDYIVPLQLTLEQLQAKIKMEDIDLGLSIGVYEGKELRGFMLHALRRDGKGAPIAYNAATGVMPEYRGRGMVGKMYGALLPEMEKLGVAKMVLEVIEGNRSGIRAYEKMGYRALRKLDCFQGKVRSVKTNADIVVKELPAFEWGTFASFWDIKPSWQNAIPSLENGRDLCRIAAAFLEGSCVGYIIFNPLSRKVNQVAVAAEHRHKGIGSALFAYLNEAVGQEEIYFNNVESSSVGTIGFLKGIGLSHNVSQFEMGLDLD